VSAQKGKWWSLGVASEGLWGVGVRITLEEVARKVQGKVDEVEIEFLTPARLKYAHKLTSQLEFHILFRALLLRLSLLVLCHGGSGI
jgi:hypothetical protein